MGVSPCYSERLALAVPENINRLKKYVDGLTGQGKALNQPPTPPSPTMSRFHVQNLDESFSLQDVENKTVPRLKVLLNSFYFKGRLYSDFRISSKLKS